MVVIRCDFCGVELVVGRDTFYEVSHVFRHEPMRQQLNEELKEVHELHTVERIDVCETCWEKNLGKKVIVKTMDVNRKS